MQQILRRKADATDFSSALARPDTGQKRDRRRTGADQRKRDEASGYEL
jgi:hypothetical protein